jgi:hypothetical protein
MSFNLSALSIIAHHEGVTLWVYDGVWDEAYRNDPRIAVLLDEEDKIISVSKCVESV